MPEPAAGSRVADAIGIAIVVGFFAFIVALMLVPIPDENRDIVIAAAGALFTMTTAVVGYHYGSSAGSKTKEITLTALAENQQPPRAPVDALAPLAPGPVEKPHVLRTADARMRGEPTQP